MLGSCLTCLSSKNLIVLGELEWMMFDFLLHPISMKYPNLRKNGMARLCKDCQKRMKFIADFRKSAIFNFKQLMSTWDLASTTITVFKVPSQCTLKNVKADVHSDNKKEVIRKIGPDIKADAMDIHTEIEIPFEQEDFKTEGINKQKYKTETDAERSKTEDDYTEDDYTEDTNNEEYIIEYLTEPEALDIEIEYDKAAVTNNEKRKQISKPLWTCTVCKKTTKTNRDLKRHMKSHNVKKKDVYCNVCDKWFTKETYKQHIKRSVKHRDDGQRAQCEICNKSYIDEKALKIHTKNIHEVGDTKVHCVPCDKWLTPYSYKIHLRISPKHVSEDKLRFICDHCNKKYINKALLRQHIKTVHLKIKPSGLLCPYCPKMFPGLSKVNSHIRVMHDSTPVPKNHVCDVCGRGFTSRIGLRKHMPVHTIQGSYKCGECDATFRFKHALTSHNLYEHGIRKPKKKRKPPQKNQENARKALDVTTKRKKNTSLKNQEIMTKKKTKSPQDIKKNTEQEQALAIEAIVGIM